PTLLLQVGDLLGEVRAVLRLDVTPADTRLERRPIRRIAFWESHGAHDAQRDLRQWMDVQDELLLEGLGFYVPVVFLLAVGARTPLRRGRLHEVDDEVRVEDHGALR